MDGSNWSEEEYNTYESALKSERDAVAIIDAAKKEGEEKGLKEGLKKGKEEGLKEGEKRGKIDLIKSLIKKGTISKEAGEKQIAEL